MMNLKYFLVLIALFYGQFLSAQIGIYWLNTPTGIERMDENGENRQTLISWEVSASPQGITMDLEGQKLYWTDWIAKKILRSNFDGSNIEDLTIDGLSLPEGITLDIGNQKMYWVDSGTKKIQRANMDGTNMEDIVVYEAVNFDGIAIDAAQGKLYWTLWGAGSAVGKVMRANVDGSDIEELVAIPNAILKGLDIDVASGKIYWTDCTFSKVQRADLNGNGMEDLVTGLSSPNAVSLDLDNQKMYWTDFGSKKIQRANLDGSNVEIVADMAVESPQDLVVNFDFFNAVGEDVAFSKITVFPNPVADFVTIEHLENVVEVAILALDGKVKQRVETPATTLKIDVSDYLNGVYFLEMVDEFGRRKIEKIQVLK